MTIDTEVVDLPPAARTGRPPLEGLPGIMVRNSTDVAWGISRIEVRGVDDQAASGANGPEAMPEPVRADPIAGEFVTEIFEYDGGRQVRVYVPPNPP